MAVKLLTTAEAAAELGVTTGRIRQLHLEGRLKGRHVGRPLIFDAREVARFAALSRPQGRPPGEASKP